MERLMNLDLLQLKVLMCLYFPNYPEKQDSTVNNKPDVWTLRFAQNHKTVVAQMFKTFCTNTAGHPCLCNILSCKTRLQEENLFAPNI